MAEQSKAPLRFQLVESIWLDHHARSAEITSLSLEPNVEIEEDSGFVSIKGYLELTGRFDTVDEGEDTLDLESSSLAEQLHYEPFRVEQKEIYQKEYKGKIEQRFPVDITLPAEKVKDIRKVYVNIDQFDYSISDQHRLNIEADIEILGISTEEKKDVLLAKKGNELRAEPLFPEFDTAALREDVEKEEEITEAPSNTLEQEGAPVESIESLRQQETGGRQEQNEAQPEYEAQTFDYAGNLSRLSDQNNEKEEVKVEKSEGGKQEVQEWQVAQFTDVEDLEERDQATQGDQEHENETDSLVKEKQEIRTHFHSSPSVVEDYDEDRAENERTSDPTATFLSQLMSYKEDPENEVTRLKMCIIQRDESLEDIAKRYDLRLTEIMRFNRLETQEVKAGQILYIPKA